MPTGVYKRTKKHKIIAKENLFLRYKRGEKIGFQKGHKTSNTGKTHFKKGLVAWNKGLPAPWAKGNNFSLGHTPWNKGKYPECYQNENHPYWKGDKVGYHGLHRWIARKLGKPKKCEDCGTTKVKMYHWANISGKYKRNLKDWRRVCVSCHHKIDKERRKIAFLRNHG